jgi:hypothetical protein
VRGHEGFWGVVRAAVAAGPEGDLAVVLGNGLLQQVEAMWGADW